jgi:CheY-like chemotaxis protein
MSGPGESQTTRILLVDDDLVIQRVYEKELSARGFKVERALDGIAAMRALRTAKPDLMVLDLMMPKMSGADVLKFTRSQPDLAKLPVIVLSNAYMDNLSREAAAAGAQLSLLKSNCTPARLVAAIHEVLQNHAGQAAPASPDAPSKEISKPAPSQGSPSTGTTTISKAPTPASSSEKADLARTEQPSHAASPGIRKEFLEHGQGTCAELRMLFQSLTNARNDAERNLRLQNFYQRIHFVTAAAGMAECLQIARMAEAVEAFIFEAMGKRSQLNPSSLRTLALTVDFLGLLFGYAQKTTATLKWAPQALVVDDDPLSNRLALTALRSAQINGTAFESPFPALEWLKGHACDLVLLDIALPGIDGFELCKQLRKMPSHEETPVVYVTQHDDFEHRAKSSLSGGDDLIGKPILPLELAVKAVMHVLDRHLTSLGVS